MESHVKELIAGVQRYRNVNSMNVACMTILVLDYFLTFDLEVSLIWNSPWSAMKVLWLLTRYLPFTDTAVFLYHQNGFGLSLRVCKLTINFASWMIIIGIAAAEVIFTLRTWAIWRKDRRLTFALPIFYTCVWTAAFVFIALYLRTTTNATSPAPHLLGCLFSDEPEMLSVCYILLLVYDGSILILTAVRAVVDLREGASQLLVIVYRDGIMYYTYLFIICIANITCIYKFPRDYFNLLITLQRAIHSLLACRVILHIREQANPDCVVASESGV